MEKFIIKVANKEEVEQVMTTQEGKIVTLEEIIDAVFGGADDESTKT